MKLHPDGTVEGTPEELAQYAKAMGITPQLSPCVAPCPLPCPTKDRDPRPDPMRYPWPNPNRPLTWIAKDGLPARIHADLCSCNPRNGGNGVCGCVIGNKPLDGSRGIGEVWASTATVTLPVSPTSGTVTIY